MSKWRIQTDVTEYYTHITEIEAETQEEALLKAEQMNAERSVADVFRDDVSFSSDTDYIVTPIDEE